MDRIKTGTTTLALLCKDGIILAADKRTTAGGFIVRKDADKIASITENIAITTAGTVSDIQNFTKLIKAELKLKKFKTNRTNTVREAANLAARMLFDGARQYFMSMTQVIMAGSDKEGFKIYQIDVDGAMLEFRDYVSTGSGSIIVYGVLENSFKEGMTVKEGEELAIKAITASMQRDTGSGNGIDVVVISKDDIRKTVQKKVLGTAQ